MPREFHLDPASIDLNKVIVDLDGIRKVNPQRFEMEQLTAIVFVDPTQHLIAGYKDVRADEFWVPGHLPKGDQVTAYVEFTDLLTGRVLTAQQAYTVNIAHSAPAAQAK